MRHKSLHAKDNSRLKLERYVLKRLKVNKELRNEGCYPKRRIGACELGCATRNRDQYKHASSSGSCMCQSAWNGVSCSSPGYHLRGRASAVS